MSGDETATYSPYTVVAAEGARIAVVTCLRCGAMVMLDPDVSHELAGQVLHDAWHEREDASLLERDMLAEENASPEEP